MHHPNNLQGPYFTLAAKTGTGVHDTLVNPNDLYNPNILLAVHCNTIYTLVNPDELYIPNIVLAEQCNTIYTLVTSRFPIYYWLNNTALGIICACKVRKSEKIFGCCCQST